eukprot:gene33468-40491_t
MAVTRLRTVLTVNDLTGEFVGIKAEPETDDATDVLSAAKKTNWRATPGVPNLSDCSAVLMSPHLALRGPGMVQYRLAAVCTWPEPPAGHLAPPWTASGAARHTYSFTAETHQCAPVVTSPYAQPGKVLEERVQGVVL